MPQTTHKKTTQQTRSPIAVVGVSAIFPGSQDEGGFWRDILAGRDLITDIPETHWLVNDYYDPDPKAPDKTYAKRGAFLGNVDFDAMAFGIPPTIAPATDTSQLLALILAQRVLNDAAQGQFDAIDKSRISVILGVTSAQELLATMIGRLQRPVWVKALREAGLPEDQVQDACQRISDQYIPWQEATFPGLLGNVVAGRIANRFDLGGTNCVTDAACASALASISMAVNELRLGESDMVIAGGVDTLNDIFMYMCFSKTPALSMSGDCRPFSDKADGTLLGEGMSMVALKRLEDAERDGDRIYAVLKGIGSSSDGRAKSVYAPLPEGQAKAIRRAYVQAGYGPESVELLEAHGTATKAGDAAEFSGLRQTFSEADRDDNQWCALGSVKSQIGHTKAAAGAAGLFKVVMALHHKALPPSIKIDRPNPNLDIDSSPFYLNTESRPWVRKGDHPRRASVSSFGFGGSNFHVAMEEYLGPGAKAKRLRTLESELILLSADDGAGLAEQCELHAVRQGLPTAPLLTWLAHQSQQEFHADADARLAIVASDDDDLRQKLASAGERLRKAPKDSFTTPQGIFCQLGAPEAGSTALLFPGQGSQYVGMGSELAIAFDAAREIWDRSADLDLDPDHDLHRINFPRPVFSDQERADQQTTLTQTQWAQPAIGAASLSQLALVQALGLEADCMAGHSYGEITALCAAGAFSQEDMLRIARKRGELMADASAIEGSMTAVVATVDELRPLLEKWGSEVSLANHNAPQQVVLSGATQAIEEVEGRLSEAGLKARRLPVGTAFHSPLVAGSSEPFHNFLKELSLSEPKVAVFSNAEIEPYSGDAEQLRRRLADQIASPVRFVEEIEAMYAKGVRSFIEVGPGSVLTGLVGKILGARPHLAISLDRKGRNGITSLWHALGRLAASGQPLDWAPLWAEYRTPVDPASIQQPKMKLEINGSNYGKLYPPAGGAAALPAPNPKIGAKPTIPEPAPTTVPAAPKATAPAAPKPTPAAPAVRPPRNPPAQVQQPRAQSVQTQQVANVNDSTRLAWVQAYQEAQRQTVDAHAEFQRTMAETQTAFLRTAEVSFAGLGQLLGTGEQGVGSLPASAPSFAPAAAAFVPQPVAQAPVPAPRAVQPAPAPAPQAPAPQAPGPQATTPQTPTPAPAAEVAAPAAALATSPAQPVTGDGPTVEGLQSLMLEVVAEKTGYPVEMLTLDMDMEADLGIDSIKRVEILSTLREKEPRLPEVDTARMATLKTLGQIVDDMKGESGVAPAGSAAPAAATEPAAPAAQTPVTAAPAAGSALDEATLQKLMLEVVADKTGYPTEMLELSMDMEADLGIDSIKRVEILSAVREQAPELPEVDTAVMATLKTLGQVVDHMRASVPETPPAQASATAPATTPAPAPAASQTASGTGPAISEARLQQLMLDVVADKTGYPADMLELSMDMEADLGIDSIKRVEILSAVREQEPALPEVDTGVMATLKTLGQVVDYMRSTAPQAASLAAAEPQPAASPAADSPPAGGAEISEARLQQLMLDVVADKTGYPADMLELSMDMEADLGIDSIKRVEILSAVREQEPALPEVDTAVMATLKTLGQVVDYMRGQKDGLDGDGPDGGPDGGPDEPARAAVPTEPAVDAPPPVVAPAMVVPATVAPATVAPATATAPPIAKLGRYALREVEAPLTGFSMQGLGSGRVVITNDGAGLATALVEELGLRGIAAQVVFEKIEGIPADTAALIHLGGLQSIADLEQARAVNRQVFQAARTLAPRFTTDGGIFVTVQDTGGNFGLGGQTSVARAALGGLAGLAKTADQEWPSATVRAIDLERGDRDAGALAKILADELLKGAGSEVEIGLRADGRRITLQSFDAPVDGDPADLPVSKDSVIVATGGARGVTAATLIELARQAETHGDGAPRFVLLGRTQLEEEPESCRGVDDGAELKKLLLQKAQAEGEKVTPMELGKRVARLQAMREIHATLEALKTAGSEAQYLPVDVQDADGLAAAFNTVRGQWGPITGLIHGAGVIADKVIAEKTDESFDRVFDTKILGLQALLDATAKDPLEVIVLFSSVTARCGNVGQSDYAMANEALNKIAAVELFRRGGRCLVKSLNWGAWEAGMVTPELKARFEAMGVALIPLAVGAQMMVDELSGGAEIATDVEVVLGAEPARGPLLAAREDHGPGTRLISLETRVSRQSHRYLESHTIEGSAVLPVVLVLEWFHRAAHAARPGSRVSQIRDFRVLRGIPLDGFETSGDLFRVQVNLGAHADSLALELADADGAPRYRAQVDLQPTDGEIQPLASPSSLDELQPWPAELLIYGDVLFHGPQFQVIQNLNGISDQGMEGQLVGTDAMLWQEANITDPALLDGGLQLAVLWFQHRLGGASLPLGIGSYRQVNDGPISGSVRAVLHSEAKDSNRVVAQLSFVDADDRVVAELKDVEIFRRPNAQVQPAPATAEAVEV